MQETFREKSPEILRSHPASRRETGEGKRQKELYRVAAPHFLCASADPRVFLLLSGHHGKGGEQRERENAKRAEQKRKDASRNAAVAQPQRGEKKTKYVPAPCDQRTKEIPLPAAKGRQAAR